MNCTNGQGDDDDDFCVNCAQPVSHLDYGETGKSQMDNITTRINSNVGSLLTSIYKLEDVTEFNFADVACCVRCGDILTSLYRFYCEFENFRESSSKLSKAILNNCSHVLVGQVESDAIKCGQFDIVPQHYDDDSPRADDTKVELASSSGLTENDPPLKSTSLSLSCQSVWPRVVLTKLKLKVISNATEKFTTKNNSSSSNNNNKEKIIRKHASQSIIATASHSEMDNNDNDEDEPNELDEDYEPNDDDEYDDDNNYKIELGSMEAEESDSSSAASTENVSTHKKIPPATAIGPKRPHRISIYPCKHCSKSLQSWTSFNYHMRHQHKLNPVDPCSFCGQSFGSRAVLRKHIRMNHKNENAFKCTNCYQYFKTESGLQAHIERRHESKFEYSCPNKCRKTFQSKSDLEHHLTERGGRCPERNKLVTCAICSESIPSFTYTTHMRKIHPGQRFQCTECPKSFAKRNHLATHSLIHFGEKKHSCHICGKSFLHKSSLINHVKVHEVIKQHSCHICGKSFLQKCSLINHVNFHEGFKSHLCSFCGRSFGSLQTLRRHTRIHTNERPFECPTCHKFFRYLSVLKQHQESIHEQSKSYMCAQCGMTFSTKWGIRRHAAVHSDDRPFKCQVPDCDWSFKTRHNLNQHAAVHREDRGDKKKGRRISKKEVNDDTP